MARSAVSDEEIQLRKRARRRLVGAVALVLLVVAAVPMILDSEPRQPPHRIEVQVPPMPQRPPSQPAPAVAVPRPAVDAPSPLSPPSSVPPPAPAPSAAPGPIPAAPPVAAAEQRPTAAGGTPQARAADAKNSDTANARTEKSTASASTDAYVVALIATSSATKAATLKRELQRQKFPAYTQRTPDGDKTRVRVGPYSSREAAEQARQRLIKQGYDPGKVVRQGD